MDIGLEFSFENALKTLPGIQVELRYMDDVKSRRTANDLYWIFNRGGWPVINYAPIGDIEEEGIVIGDKGDDASERASHFLLKFLTDRGVPSELYGNVRIPTTNTIIVAVCQRPNQAKAEYMALWEKFVELNDQQRKISLRVQALRAKPTNSKAETEELNDLNAQSAKLSNEKHALVTEQKKMAERISGQNPTFDIDMKNLKDILPPLQ